MEKIPATGETLTKDKLTFAPNPYRKDEFFTSLRVSPLLSLVTVVVLKNCQLTA